MTRSTRRVLALLAVGFAVFTASAVFKGRPTIYRLEQLLDRYPDGLEVREFAERNGLPHSVVPDGDGAVIYALIDTCPVPFESAECYRIRLDARGRVIGYTSHSESVAP